VAARLWSRLKTENRKQKTENRKQKTENRKQKTENRKQKTENSYFWGKHAAWRQDQGAAANR
jgi:hypothetical protein